MESCQNTFIQATIKIRGKSWGVNRFFNEFLSKLVDIVSQRKEPEVYDPFTHGHLGTDIQVLTHHRFLHSSQVLVSCEMHSSNQTLVSPPMKIFSRMLSTLLPGYPLCPCLSSYTVLNTLIFLLCNKASCQFIYWSRSWAIITDKLNHPKTDWLPKFFWCLSHALKHICSIDTIFTCIPDNRKLTRPLVPFPNRHIFLISRGM